MAVNREQLPRIGTGFRKIIRITDFARLFDGGGAFNLTAAFALEEKAPNETRVHWRGAYTRASRYEPSTREALLSTEFSAIPLGNWSEPTTSTTNVWRAGISSALVTPSSTSFSCAA